jgi:chaperonin cofactor prefoldin
MHDEKTPAFQGIDPLQIVAVLTKAVQELTAKLEAAEARIATLENR